MNELDIGIETLGLTSRGQVCEFVKQDRFHNAFFTKLIVEDGLLDAHITIQAGLTDKERRQLIQQEIDGWDNPKEQILEL